MQSNPPTRKSPTARSLQALRGDGWTAQVVESWIHGANIRRDLWGIGDVLAMKPAEPLLLIQCTSATNVSARIHKAEAEPRLRTWLACGHRFEIWGWGKVDGRWTVRKAIVLSDFRELPGTSGELDVQRPPRRPRKRKELTLWGAA